jgi:hypothetical protein
MFALPDALRGSLETWIHLNSNYPAEGLQVLISPAHQVRF